jgi:hypothetical protein
VRVSFDALSVRSQKYSSAIAPMPRSSFRDTFGKAICQASYADSAMFFVGQHGMQLTRRNSGTKTFGPPTRQRNLFRFMFVSGIRLRRQHGSASNCYGTGRAGGTPHGYIRRSSAIAFRSIL